MLEGWCDFRTCGASCLEDGHEIRYSKSDRMIRLLDHEINILRQGAVGGLPTLDDASKALCPTRQKC